MLRDAPVSVFQSDDSGDDGLTLARLAYCSLVSAEVPLSFSSLLDFEFSHFPFTADAQVQLCCCKCFFV
jgi:hypothetical protein